MEEGVALQQIARASGLPVDALERLEVPGAQVRVPTDEELGQRAAKLAMKALVEGEKILESGDPASRVRLILGLSQHPMRRMTTDQGEQSERMQLLLERILSGGTVIDDDDEPTAEDATEDTQA